MAKLVIKKQTDRQPTEDDISQAAEACGGPGVTARSLAGRTGMTIKTAMRALWAAQKADSYIKTEWVPLKGGYCVQHLLYRKLG